MDALATPAFERVRRLIRDIAGISLSPTKRTMAANRLSPRLQATGRDDFGSYLDLVEAPDSAERVHFVNALTTNLTSFFREPHHFPALVEHLRLRGSRTNPVVWSAACSTGEEPYSIAMALAEAGLGAARVIASDLDTEALETASAGEYAMQRVASLGDARLKRFFLRGHGPHRGRVKVRPEIAAMVEFRHINLCVERWPVQGPLDAIFCRNAMIYFAKQTQLEVLTRFRPLLAGGGLLFAGHSENFHYLAGHLLRARGGTVYEPVE
jgi:chemotaxis protein methyltransferase CheR